MGGSLGRREATGRGVMIAARESAKHVGFNIKGAKVAVQGFGNVGSISAELLASAVGATIVAVTDWKGGIFNAKGLDIPKLLDYVKQHKTVEGFAGAEPLTNADLFGLDVDILIPAALENQITIDNAPSIKAKVIIEGANGPTTPDAHKYLHDHGVFVVPDILANSSGVTTSVLRVGAGSLRLFLDREGSQRAPRGQDVRGVQRGAADVAEVQGRHAHGRLHRRDRPRCHRHADAGNVRVVG